MAKVDLVYATVGARELLIFTKSTRLNMTPGLLDKVVKMSDEEKENELNYMAGTIQSSWEFVDLIFLIQNVSRACAQQITRTRNASYAMQSQRVTDLSEFTVHWPKDDQKITRLYGNAIQNAKRSYKALMEAGASPETARGILPMNVHCNLICKYNLRAFSDLCKSRLSHRVQGEYRNIVQQMKDLTIKEWPWCGPFLEPREAGAIEVVDQAVQSFKDMGLSDHALKLAKAADILKKG